MFKIGFSDIKGHFFYTLLIVSDHIIFLHPNIGNISSVVAVVMM